jgi:hypothetical protein
MRIQFLTATGITLLFLMLVILGGCNSGQEATMDQLVLPKLEVPDNALLLYENIAVNNPDRTGNFRFVFLDDGTYYNARNTQLWVTDTDKLSSDQPDLFWNKPFPGKPDRQLTDDQLQELKDAIDKADFSSLKKEYLPEDPGEINDAVVERWTVVEKGSKHTVVAAQGITPAKLDRLHKTLGEIVSKAKSP